MVGLLNMKNVVTVLENNNSNNEHKQSEENLKVKEITMAVEEDDISSVSASLDQSLSIVSCSSTTSRKRKASLSMKKSKKLNSIMENSKVNYVRVVFICCCQKEQIIKFMNENDKSYDNFKSCFNDHSFYWYVYCDDNKKKSKNHRYTMISEYVITLITNEKIVNDWKIIAYKNFIDSRMKLSKQIESDDVRDIDYLNNYQNRGNINVFNIFYFECEDMLYFIDNTVLKHNLYYYNKLKDMFFGIYVRENDRMSIEECDVMSINITHGPTFSLEIKKLWLDISKNPYLHL
jgi:hypothetical protein